MKAKDLLVEFYDESATDEFGYISSADEDELEPLKKGDTRKRPKLTLKHLNKLRKLKQVKRKEKIKHLDLVQRMYGNKPDME
jgi:hypothetical protein